MELQEIIGLTEGLTMLVVELELFYSTRMTLVITIVYLQEE